MGAHITMHADVLLNTHTHSNKEKGALVKIGMHLLCKLKLLA
jgi:hypothetical protein